MTEQTDDMDLDRIEAKAKAATPGEWRAECIDGTCGPFFLYVDGVKLLVPGWRVEGPLTVGNHESEALTDRDAKYIEAVQPAAVLALCGEIRRLRAENERLRPYEPRVLPSDFPREMAVGCAHGFFAHIVKSFEVLNGNANYSVTEVQTAGGGKYEVTVRRADKPTPHELRKKAEADRDAFRAALEHYAALGPDAVPYADTINDPPDVGRVARQALAAAGGATPLATF